jgi:hypothetical protein
MLTRAAWAFLVLCWASGSITTVAQADGFHFTMGVTSPAPVPGKPFTITWAGGSPTQPVYIHLDNYFPPTPNQDIIYGGEDILCRLHALRAAHFALSLLD